MSFCANCGSRLEEGTQFCGNCGTPVETAGQGPVQNNMAKQPVNNVPRPNPAPQPQYQQQQYQQQQYQQPPYQQQQPYQQYQQYQQPYNAAPSPIGIYFGQVFDTFKNIILRPATSILRVKNALSNEASFILGGILVIVYSLLNLWLASAVSTNMESASKHFDVNSTLSISYIYGALVYAFKMGLQYQKIFFYSLLLFILTIGLIFGAIVLLGKTMFKSQANAASLWKIVISSAIPYVAFMIVQTILSYLSIGLGFVFGFVGIIVSLLILYKGIEAELKIGENSAVYLLPISFAVVLIIMTLIINALIMKGLKNGFPFF